MKVTTVSILVMLGVVCCNAQQILLSDRIHVITDIHNGVGIRKYQNKDSAHILVTLRNGVTTQDLSRSGINVVRTLSNNLVIAEGNVDRVQGRTHLVADATEVNYQWKLADNLVGFQADEMGEYVISSSNAKQLAQRMRTHHFNVSLEGNVVHVTGDLSDIAQFVLPIDDVIYLGQESFEPREEGRVLDLYLAPNHISQIHRHYPQLNGENIVISLKERQYDKKDIDLRGRHVPSDLASADSSDHATEMATIIAGAGNSFVTGRGVASHAKITSSSFSNMFPDDAVDFTTLNSFLQNHSYGTVVENFYGALASAYDQHTYENPTILHVFSSGNSGTATATSGVYTSAPGFANLTGNAKMAKNILVVGSMDTTRNAVSFSSRGPAHDGRIKPEIVAYSSVGTSNSAALVSGVAALLQQAFKNQTNAYPQSALIKAVLINAADDAGIPGIDFTTGFGSLNGYRALNNLLEGRYFTGSITQNEIKSFALNVPAEARNLRVTLVWTDAPGGINSAKALINNLDLTLTTSAETVLPWVLNTAPTVASLSSPATRGIDTRNNVEQISIENPSPGLATIAVKGTAMASANQSFFIAYQWDEAQTFTWNYPTASDNFPYDGESGTYFYWHSTLTAQKGELEVTTNGGSTWTTIARQVDLKKGYYRWRQPFLFNTAAMARMKVENTYFPTEEFTISRTLLPSLGFSCGDSVLLQWNGLENVPQYEVKKLTGDYLSYALQQADTSVVLKTNAGAVYYSIHPIISGGKPLLRSPAINIKTFGAGCFISSFIDERVSEEGILLRLGLGTTYGVTDVTFEHEQPSGFVPINAIADPQENILRFLHSDPIQGRNRYRARVQLINGQELITDTIQNYFISQSPFIVFPNPVSAPEPLSVYSGRFEKFDFSFELFNANGQKVRVSDLRSDREFVPTQGLPPGLYLYRIRGQAIDTCGRIIIE
ncbi:MAG TPA: S8 family serine peptidase [Chryseosolibacter sp.]